jgi:predicted DNA-binding ribbon-helix-helix protein
LGARGEHAGAEISPKTLASKWEIADADTMRKRSVVIAGHRTSVSLETAFWAGLKEIADMRCVSVNRLVESIDAARATNLSSAIRVFVLRWYRDQTVRDAALPH